MYDVNYGRNRLREVFAAVPGLQNSLLAKSSKRFEEAFTNMVTRRSSFSGQLNGIRKSSKEEQTKSETSSLLDNLKHENQENDDEVDSEVANVMETADKSPDSEKNGVKTDKHCSGYNSLDEHQNGGKDSPAFRDRNLSLGAKDRDSPAFRDRNLSISSNSDGRRMSLGSSSNGNGNEHPDTVISGLVNNAHFQVSANFLGYQELFTYYV